MAYQEFVEHMKTVRRDLFDNIDDYEIECDCQHIKGNVDYNNLLSSALDRLYYMYLRGDDQDWQEADDFLKLLPEPYFSLYNGKT